MDWYQLIITVIGVIGSGSAVTTFLLYRRQETRIKDAEAFEKEVTVLRLEVETLRDQIKFYAERQEAQQRLIVNKDAYIEQLTRDKQIVEIKHAKNKSAMNRAYECDYCVGEALKCPVLKQRAENEEEYLRSIDAK